MSCWLKNRHQVNHPSGFIPLILDIKLLFSHSFKLFWTCFCFKYTQSPLNHSILYWSPNHHYCALSDPPFPCWVVSCNHNSSVPWTNACTAIEHLGISFRVPSEEQSCQSNISSLKQRKSTNGSCSCHREFGLARGQLRLKCELICKYLRVLGPTV